MDMESVAIALPDRSAQYTDTFAASPDELKLLDAYWRAANYLSVGQIYLYDNPLLREPLTLAHVKPLVVGHWGTSPGQNFIYVHLNRVIKAAHPGHVTDLERWMRSYRPEELFAAVSILREHLPALMMGVINVVDLMRPQTELEHPHGLSDTDYDALFTTDKPIIFGFHGYPWLVHRPTYRRTNRHLQHMADKLIKHKHHIDRHGEDMPEIRDWMWTARP